MICWINKNITVSCSHLFWRFAVKNPHCLTRKRLQHKQEKKVGLTWQNQNRRAFMVDFCPKCIHIVRVTTARICSGWKEKGGGGGGSDSRLLSITGRKDKNLLSLCQHSSAQRDFIDQRTAMQEPLLHPSDTIYHAPSFPPSFPAFFSARRLSVHPIMQKRHTHTRQNFLEKAGSFWCKWLGAKCKTSDIPTRYNKWTQSKGSKGNKLRFGGATWINSGAKRIFFTLINHSSCHHRHIW